MSDEKPPYTPWVQRACYPDLFFRLLDPALLMNPKTHEILEANDASEHAFGASKKSLIHGCPNVLSDRLSSISARKDTLR